MHLKRGEAAGRTQTSHLLHVIQQAISLDGERRERARLAEHSTPPRLEAFDVEHKACETRDTSEREKSFVGKDTDIIVAQCQSV
jgi:hypothetical protein